jgi:transcriptional regulator with XRE-family HTH domain
VHPRLNQLFRGIRSKRDDAGLSAEDVEAQLVLGPGWVHRFESGQVEPSIGTLSALLHLYGSSLAEFFSEVDLDLGDETVALDRHLTASEDGDDLRLHFPMGRYAASVTIPTATLEEFNSVLSTLRAGLSSGLGHRRDAVVACFLTAVATWPEANPSDLWYFLVSHAYQDGYNHPASAPGDWAQSWKRTGGWAFEQVLLDHYNEHLSTQGLMLEMPMPERRVALLTQMGIPDPAEAAQKADVIALGQTAGRSRPVRGALWVPFGVVHVKTSFAERRTGDGPLSRELMSRGYASPFVTMDSKATPAETPTNRGELGPVQGGSQRVSAKRLDIERENKFDACFSYNQNTLPTPDGQTAAARITVINFNDPDDAFSRHLVRKWRTRQGLD